MQQTWGAVHLVGWLFFFHITEQTSNSAQYYDGDVYVSAECTER